MEKKIYYEDNWLNQHLNKVGLLDKKLSLSGVMCCVCGVELTIEENEENLTYDVRERICDKCNSELSEERKHCT